MTSFNARKQSGTSLLEVLIAVLVLAIGMLGMAALQSVTLRNSNSSSGRSQAVMQAYSMFDTMRMDRTRALQGAFNVANWTCTAATKTAADDATDYTVFNSWLAQVQANLGDPSACGRASCTAAECVVGIRWDDSRPTGAADDKQLEIVTRSRL
ncbi:type IV pilus modification protein PilV [Lysobacter humi (ex Lee et al. 2017)]